MPAEALAFYGIYFAVAFVARSLVQYHRTGSTGFRGVSGAAGSAEWWGGVLFVLAFALGVLGAVLQLLDVVEPIDAIDTEFVQAAGAGMFLGGFLTTIVAQLAMGDSWRIGVDESERTELVTGGPFAAVRNPIFSGMIPVTLGFTLLVPNPLAVAGFVALVVALEIQTRLVEEPYLLATHGDTYAGYAARVGRFFPYVGRLRPRRG